MFKNIIFLAMRSMISFLFIIAMNSVNANAEKSWTGPYLGANAGGFWGSSNVVTSAVQSTLLNQPALFDFFTQNSIGTLSLKGFTAGIEGGYNLQLAPLLLGLELDFDSLPDTSTRMITQNYLPDQSGGAYIEQQTLKTKWLFTLRPRLGYTTNNILLYFTGGLAVTELTGAYSLFDGATYIPGGQSKTQSGWALGGGAEYKLKGQWDHWALKLEYLYTNFRKISVVAISQPAVPGQIAGVGDPLSTSVSFHSSIARVGVNYQF